MSLLRNFTLLAVHQFRSQSRLVRALGRDRVPGADGPGKDLGVIEASQPPLQLYLPPHSSRHQARQLVFDNRHHQCPDMMIGSHRLVMAEAGMEFGRRIDRVAEI